MPGQASLLECGRPVSLQHLAHQASRAGAQPLSAWLAQGRMARMEIAPVPDPFWFRLPVTRKGMQGFAHGARGVRRDHALRACGLEAAF